MQVESLMNWKSSIFFKYFPFLFAGGQHNKCFDPCCFFILMINYPFNRQPVNISCFKVSLAVTLTINQNLLREVTFTLREIIVFASMFSCG